jgi:hypothetical protein
MFKFSRFNGVLFMGAMLALPSLVRAGPHAPYGTLYYKGSSQPGDILVNEICPTITTTDTYFNALGWENGYTGVQENENGDRNVIFSLWDSSETKGKPIRKLYALGGATVEPFDGEGTGLHYLNKTQPWRLNQWMRFVVRRWDDPADTANTYYALWIQAEDTGIWTHHVTMIYPAAHRMFTAFIYSFLEDWTGTGLTRRVQYRNPAERLASGKWFALDHAGFLAQFLELSGPLIKAYDAGVTGNTFFMQTGGDTTSKIDKSTDLVLPPFSPRPSVPPIEADSASAQLNAAGDQVKVTWHIKDTATPQFRYQVQVFGTSTYSGTPIQIASDCDPEARQATLPVSKGLAPLYVKLIVTDIFDGTCVRLLGNVSAHL